MSTSKIRKSRKQRKEAVDFELDPPACVNCKHFKHAEYANPASVKSYKPPTCKIGNFQVRQNSICDIWVDKKTGDHLEPKQKDDHAVQ